MDLSRIVLPVLHNKRFKNFFFFFLHSTRIYAYSKNTIALHKGCRDDVASDILLFNFLRWFRFDAYRIKSRIFIHYYLLCQLQTWYIKINVIFSFLASLFYTSVKEDKNCDLLYKYLVHRIFGFPFKTPALVVEKDAVFMWV